MTDFVFCIPSYNRPNNQRFIKFLTGLGYGRESIYLGTQTEKDYEEYIKLYGSVAHVIYRNGRNVCDNKNYLLEAVNGHRIVMVSDKVEAICTLGKGKTMPISSRTMLDNVVGWAFMVSSRLKADIWGVYPVNNHFFMDNSFHINQLLLGCCMGFEANTKIRFNPDCPLKEDFEVSLRTIASGHRVVRFDNISLKETFHQKGGSYELWHTEGDYVNKKCCDYLLSVYPDLVEPHRTRANEIRYIGKTKKINL